MFLVWILLPFHLQLKVMPPFWQKVRAHFKGAATLNSFDTNIPGKYGLYHIVSTLGRWIWHILVNHIFDIPAFSTEMIVADVGFQTHVAHRGATGARHLVTSLRLKESLLTLKARPDHRFCYLVLNKRAHVCLSYKYLIKNLHKVQLDLDL